MDHPPDLTPDIKETDLPQEEQEAQPGDLVELPFFDEDFNLKRQVKIPEIDSDLLSSNLRDEFVHPGGTFWLEACTREHDGLELTQWISFVFNSASTLRKHSGRQKSHFPSLTCLQSLFSRYEPVH